LAEIALDRRLGDVQLPGAVTKRYGGSQYTDDRYDDDQFDDGKPVRTLYSHGIFLEEKYSTSA
jgi:hypothetical protein